MIGPIPKKPAGGSPAALFMQAQWEATYGSGRAQSSSGDRINRTTRGFSIASRGGGGGPGTKIRMVILRMVEPKYLICRSWDGENLGETDLYVAKQVLHRTVEVDAETEQTEEFHFAKNGAGDPVWCDHVFTYDYDEAEPEPTIPTEEEIADGELDFGETEEMISSGEVHKLNAIRTVTRTIPESSEGAADGTERTEDQRIVPVWRKGEVLYAIKAKTDIEVPADPEADPPTVARPITLLHSCEARQWAKTFG